MSIVDREQCPECLDSTEDAVAVYEDGHKFCFKCNSLIEKESLFLENKIVGKELLLNLDPKLLKGSFLELKNRKISLETCQLYNVQIGKYTGSFGKGDKQRFAENELILIYNYIENNRIYAQKIKSQYKEMFWKGNASNPGLYLEWKYHPNSNFFITVVEGEEDALTIAQTMGYQYPIVSVPTGAGGAEKAIQKSLKYLQEFKYVILGFDNDEGGHLATEKCLKLFEPGRVRVIDWKRKDANDMLKVGEIEEIKRCIWLAKEIRPKSLVTVLDVLDKVLEQPQYGLDWPWQTMTKITYGLRLNEISCIVGPSGAGKTAMITKIISHFLKTTGTGVFSFEQNPEDTIRRYVGDQLGLKLEKPGEIWEPEKIKRLAMDLNEKIYLYNLGGKVDIKDIFYCIRYLNKAKGFKLFVIDNLKSLRVVFKKEECAEFATSLKALVKELNIHVILVSHVNKNTIRQSTHVGFSSKIENPHENLTEESIRDTMNKFKIDWETGRMPSTADIEGGNDIEAVCDYIFGIARNKLSDTEKERRIIHVKPLKCGRIDSEYSHITFDLYRDDSGSLIEINNDSVGEF